MPPASGTYQLRSFGNSDVFAVVRADGERALSIEIRREDCDADVQSRIDALLALVDARLRAKERAALKATLHLL